MLVDAAGELVLPVFTQEMLSQDQRNPFGEQVVLKRLFIGEQSFIGEVALLGESLREERQHVLVEVSCPEDQQ